MKTREKIEKLRLFVNEHTTLVAGYEFAEKYDWVAIYNYIAELLSSPEKKEEVEYSAIPDKAMSEELYQMNKKAIREYGKQVEKEEPTQELKKSVSEIFIKWGLPTRQVAINEIVSLIERLLK